LMIGAVVVAGLFGVVAIAKALK
ncbi:hypothetical protein LCGC14_2171360, partial [marine sediment metagenome]